jgi:hypothetical protein
MASDGVWLTAMKKDNITGSPRLCHIALTEPLLQLLCQRHVARRALQATTGSLGQNVTAFGAMKCHGANEVERRG